MEKLSHIWPKLADLADDLALPYPTVAAWVRRGIPARRFPQIIAAAQAKGHALTWETLLGAASAATGVSKEEDAA